MTHYNIPNDYFLLTLLDYRDNYDKLINEDIAIIQYPKGEMNYSYGKIKLLKSQRKQNMNLFMMLVLMKAHQEAQYF